MKKITLKLTILIVCLIQLTTSQSTTAQEIQGFINDQANIIDNEQQIEQILQNLYDQDLAQIAIVTVPSLEGKEIESLAFEMAEGNLGTKDKDNGLLILISFEERKYRFEVGRGLEPIFNDAKIGRYGRDFLVPNFKQEDYNTGVLLVINEINKELTGNEIENLPATIQTQQSFNIRTRIQMLFSLFFFFIIFSGLITKRNSRIKDDRYFWGAVIASQILRGGSGKGLGGGGFGGFGGGSFGGGGAGGSW